MTIVFFIPRKICRRRIRVGVFIGTYPAEIYLVVWRILITHLTQIPVYRYLNWVSYPPGIVHCNEVKRTGPLITMLTVFICKSPPPPTWVIDASATAFPFES